MQIKFKFKGFEIFLWKKKRFRLAIERPGLESQHSQKRLFFYRKISNSLNLSFIIEFIQILKYCKFSNLGLIENFHKNNL